MTKKESIFSTSSSSLAPPLPAKTPEILFEDSHLMVLSKPAGLLSQGEHRGEANIVDWLRSYWGRHYVGLVHRLDRSTSGLMVVAKRSKAAQRLSLALQQQKFSKTYLAWVLGRLKSRAIWNHQLLKDPQTHLSKVVKEGGKQASLEADPLSTGQWKQNTITLVQILLKTGRSHQIRVQSAYERHPILGDYQYGGSGATLGFSRVALHSYRLGFPHPMSNEQLQFQSELPKELASLGETGEHD